MKIIEDVPVLNTPVRVTWLDSVDQPGWSYASLGEKLDFSLRPPMQTRGVLVAADATSVAVAATIAPAGPADMKTGYMDVLTIPIGCVLEILEIP